MTKLLPLCLLSALLSACGDEALPVERARPVPFQPTQVAARADLASTAAFADQAGGGIFATTSGTAVRLRLDGTVARLEAHPGNDVQMGAVRSAFRLGPHTALVEADQGLFLADAGWLIAPPWRDALGPGTTATAQASDGAVWLSHPSGLYRLQDGNLSALKVDEQPLTGITALAAAPSPEGSVGIWFLRDGGLSVVVPKGVGVYDVRSVSLPLESGETLQSLAALGQGVGRVGELWVLTSQGLLRRKADGWYRVELSPRPVQLLAAGRFLWVKSSDALLVYDADANTWGLATGVDTREFRFLAADESGCAWVQLGGDTVAISRAPVPRVSGLYQGMQVVEEGLVVRATLPPGAQPVSVTYVLGGAEIPSAAPDYSMGGLEADGTLRAYSFVGLNPGRYSLEVVSRFEDGSEARRSVPFDYAPVSTVALSYAADIKPIHEARCAKCHVSGPGRPLSTYELWKENAALITASVRDQRMPADGPLDPQLISRIQRWAASGAKP